MNLSIRDMTVHDVGAVVNYFSDAPDEYLFGMGADPHLLPSKEQWKKYINEELSKPYHEKEIYYIIRQSNNQPVGHSNINKIHFGKEAHMHLHMWKPENRKKGIGTAFVKMSIPRYFEKFDLKKLICEPYALNPAPIKTLESLGFDFIKEYQSVPGKICFEQRVKHFELARTKWQEHKTQ